MRTGKARQANGTGGTPAKGAPAKGNGAEAAGGGRQWARADATRRALLNAALEVFADRGYADAGIAEIVERSGISVGSLYHHYGGKAGLYVALWEDLTAEQEASAAQAVSAARKDAAASADGESDPIALFIAGARAYLRVCWERREAARLFHGGEGPSGSSLMRRSRAQHWIAQNTKLLGGSAGGAPANRPEQVLSLVLTTVIGEAGREIATAENEGEATEILEEVCRILIRLAR